MLEEKKLSREKHACNYVRIDASNFNFVLRRIEVSARYVNEIFDRCGKREKYLQSGREKGKDNRLMNRLIKRLAEGYMDFAGCTIRRLPVAGTAATKGIQPPTAPGATAATTAAPFLVRCIHGPTRNPIPVESRPLVRRTRA